MLNKQGLYNGILNFSCYMSLAIGFLPVVNYICPWYITAIPFVLMLLVTIKNKSDFSLVLSLLFTIVLCCLLEFWIVYRARDFLNYFINFVVECFSIVFAAQIQKSENNSRFYKKYLQLAAVFAGITAITTIIGLDIYPMASRELASGTAFFDTSKYSIINIGGYDYIYGMVMFVPVLFFLIKNNKGVKKILNLVILAIVVVCVYQSQYTIALISLIVSFIVVWISLMKRKRLVSIIAIIVLIVLLSTGLLANFFGWLSGIVGHEYVSDRLMQLSQLLSGQPIHTDTTTERMEHYQRQIELFFSSPLWGHNIVDYNGDFVSGHTNILDILGGAGIIGMSILIVLVKKIQKVVFKKKLKSNFSKAMWILFILIATINPVIFSANLLIVFVCSVCVEKIEE